jgi:diadenosine tetraphosphatase ApaH/serine/threonine PP2A family protein phosphatase
MDFTMSVSYLKPQSNKFLNFKFNNSFHIFLYLGKNRLSLKAWKRFCDVFNVMPVSALIEDKILCMHGGLAYDLKNVREINNIQRPTEVPDSGKRKIFKKRKIKI